jgi:hypothetical protein
LFISVLLNNTLQFIVRNKIPIVLQYYVDQWTSNSIGVYCDILTMCVLSNNNPAIQDKITVVTLHNLVAIFVWEREY